MCLVDNSVDNSFCFYIQTILSTLSTILYAIPPSKLSTLYPQLFSTYPHVIHSLSTILSTFYPNVVDIFYRLLSSSLLKFFIIFSIISLYGLIGSFLENYHIPTSGVTNDWQIKGKLGCHKRHPERKLWYFKGILRYLDCPYGDRKSVV